MVDHRKSILRFILRVVAAGKEASEQIMTPEVFGYLREDTPVMLLTLTNPSGTEDLARRSDSVSMGWAINGSVSSRNVATPTVSYANSLISTFR